MSYSTTPVTEYIGSIVLVDDTAGLLDDGLIAACRKGLEKSGVSRHRTTIIGAARLGRPLKELEAA